MLHRLIPLQAIAILAFAFSASKTSGVEMSRKLELSNLTSTFSGMKDDYSADYDATKPSRFVPRRTGLAPQGGTADYHFRSESQYYTLMENMRDMDRNGDVLGQAITRSTANIVQDGFTLSPNTGDKDINTVLYDYFYGWAQDADECDVAGEMVWNDFELMAMRSISVDGDCVVLGTKNGHLQFIEAHSVATKNKHVNTFLGVTMDSLRKRSKYWIAADPIQPGKGKETAIPVSVRDAEGNRQLFHPYIRSRSSQTRGVGALAPIFPTSGMVSDIRFAKLVQQQVSACFVLIKTKAAQSATPKVGDPGYGESSTQTTSTGQTRYIEGIAPGMEKELNPGEGMEGFSPNIVSSEFFQHVWLELSIIGANLGMPVCQMLLDFSHETFVGFRGATDEARKGFRTNQNNLIKRLHTPVYKFKVRQFIAKSQVLRDKLKAGTVDLFCHTWHPPAWPYVEPVNDAAGDLLRRRNGLISPRRQMAERQMDFETVAVESVEDNGFQIIEAKKKAAAINAMFPDDDFPVSWRDCINVPTPDGIQISMAPQGQPQATAKPQPTGGKNA